MAEPFLAEIRIVGFNFPPRGWAQCDGQILPINQNQSLYSLLGTTYGGDGRNTFALPDLRGRVPIHEGSSSTGGASSSLGDKAGSENQPLSVDEIPSHSHRLNASGDQASTGDPAGNALAGQPLFTAPFYAAVPNAANTRNLNDGTIANSGGQGHNNMQPYQTLNYVIALRGVFPSRN